MSCRTLRPPRLAFARGPFCHRLVIVRTCQRVVNDAPPPLPPPAPAHLSSICTVCRFFFLPHHENYTQTPARELEFMAPRGHTDKRASAVRTNTHLTGRIKRLSGVIAAVTECARSPCFFPSSQSPARTWFIKFIFTCFWCRSHLQRVAIQTSHIQSFAVRVHYLCGV